MINPARLLDHQLTEQAQRALIAERLEWDELVSRCAELELEDRLAAYAPADLERDAMLARRVPHVDVRDASPATVATRDASRRSGAKGRVPPAGATRGRVRGPPVTP